MFDNKITFLTKNSLKIRYHFIVNLLNHQVPTTLMVCKIQRNVYEMKYFLLWVMNMDPNLEPLHPWLDQIQIYINTNRKGNNIPEAEEIIQITKDSTRDTLSITPFNKPFTMLDVGLILETMLWGNDIYVEDNASISIIPDAIVTLLLIQ